MGSRIMHYCISSVLFQKLQIVNKNEFLLGGIAPDAHYYMNVPKDITHFVDRDENGKGHINYMRFYNKYKEFLDRPFFLGYLCHLISDDVWSTDTYLQIVKEMPKEERKEKLRPICLIGFKKISVMKKMQQGNGWSCLMTITARL